MSFDIGLQAQSYFCLRLAGCWKRPSCLRAQSGLSCGSRRCRRRFGSGFLRGFLCSRLLRCFLCCRLFGRNFFCSSFLRYLLGGRLFRGSSFFGRSLFGCYFLCCYFFRWSLFRRRLLCRSFFGRGFFGRYFFSWCFLGSHFFGGSLLCRYFFSRRFLRCSFFSCWFFRSCHSFLLDHIAKSTSRLEYAKRFTALGLRMPGPAPRTQEQCPSHALRRCRWSLQFENSFLLLVAV